MKIAVIAHLSHPIAEPFAGGMEMFTHSLVKGLQKKGHKVDVFACAGSDPTLKYKKVNLNSVDCNETADVPPDHPAFDTDFIQKHHAYLEIMQRIRKGNYDIVHNNSLHYLPITMARTLSIPMVTTLHVPPYATMNLTVAYSKKFAGGSQYVAVSQHLADSWTPYAGKSTVIHNGTEVETCKHRYHVNANSAVWFGRICPDKAPHLAIQAAAKSETFLYLGGKITDPEYFEKEVKPLLNPRLNAYVGHVDKKEVNRFTARTKVLLMTSVWEEPFGLVVAEALAAGTPVAAFNTGGVPEILTKKTGRIVEKGNVDALAQAIKECKELNRQDCRKRAKKAFGLDIMIENYERYFKQIIRRKQMMVVRPQGFAEVKQAAV